MSADMTAKDREVLVGWALPLAVVWVVDILILLKWI